MGWVVNLVSVPDQKGTEMVFGPFVGSKAFAVASLFPWVNVLSVAKGGGKSFMPLPHIKRRCTATCRATRERCKNPSAYGMATCRYHGARKPNTVLRGEDHPQYLHGKYAQTMRTKYRAASPRSGFTHGAKTAKSISTRIRMP